MISNTVKRTLYAAIILLLLALATIFLFQYKIIVSNNNKNVAVSGLKNTAPANTNTITPPSQTQHAGISAMLLACEQQNRNIQNIFPNANDNETNDADANVPSDYIHVLSIPEHTTTNKILRVYFKPTCDEIILTMYHPDTKSAVFVGAIEQKVGGNSGGIYVPFAFTKDDSAILLDAWMGTPGAGGSSIDYGYAEIPVKAGNVKSPTLTPTSIATRSATFYDTFGKVVYTDSGSNTPSNGQPGPPNNAVVLVQNLVTNVKTTVENATNTSYQILSVDETKNELHLAATVYTFTKNCPRQEGNLYCANKTVSKPVIPLP